MSFLGAVKHGLINEEWVSYFNKEQQTVTIIENKEALWQLDGVILIMETKEELSFVIEWLLASKKIPHLFIWVFSVLSLDYEEEVLLELGANEVFVSMNQLWKIPLVAKNTFNRLEKNNNLQISENETNLINRHNQSILVNGSEQLLTQKEYQLFVFLAEHEGTCVPYDTLITQLWPGKSKSRLYQLTNLVYHLRKKIEPNDQFMIKTIRSKGFLLERKGS